MTANEWARRRKAEVVRAAQERAERILALCLLAQQQRDRIAEAERQAQWQVTASALLAAVAATLN